MTVSYFPENLFYELLWTSWNASWYASNSRPIWDKNEYELVRNKDRFEDHAKKFYEIGKELGISKDVAENIKWGAWNAAWRAANMMSKNIFDIKNDEKKFNEHFENIEISGEFDFNLVHHIKFMCSDWAFYCTHMRITHNIEEQKEMSNRAIRHCLKICPIIYENDLRECLNLDSNPYAKKFEYNDPDPVMKELIATIQELINRIEKEDSTNSEKELINQAIQSINNEDTRSLKEKIKGAFVEGSLAGIEKATDNIIGATIVGVIRGFKGK